MKILIVEPLADRSEGLYQAILEQMKTDNILEDANVHIVRDYNKLLLQPRTDWPGQEKIITFIDLVQNNTEAEAFNRKGYAWWPKICKRVVDELKSCKNQFFIITVYTDLPFSIAGEAWAKNLFSLSSGNSVYSLFIYKGRGIDKSDLSEKLLRAMVALK